jgi:hypothetical protein
MRSFALAAERLGVVVVVGLMLPAAGAGLRLSPLRLAFALLSADAMPPLYESR